MKQNQKSIVSVLLALFLLLSLAGCSAFNVTAPKRTNWRTDSLGGVQYKVLRSWLKETPDTDAVKYTTKNSELTVTSSDEDVAAFSTYRGQRLRAIAIERELPDFGRASFRTEEIAGANAMVLNGSCSLNDQPATFDCIGLRAGDKVYTFLYRVTEDAPEQEAKAFAVIKDSIARKVDKGENNAAANRAQADSETLAGQMDETLSSYIATDATSGKSTLNCSVSEGKLNVSVMVTDDRYMAPIADQLIRDAKFVAEKYELELGTFLIETADSRVSWRCETEPWTIGAYANIDANYRVDFALRSLYGHYGYAGRNLVREPGVVTDEAETTTAAVTDTVAAPTAPGAAF